MPHSRSIVDTVIPAASIPVAVVRTAPTPAARRQAGTARRVGAVDGLRGLALLLVVAFHLFGHGRVSGGVDVFLVLSGYFATGTLLRRAEDGTLRLGAHYARTLARLLPAALVVLAAVTVTLFTLTPRMRWSSGLREVGASATFWENWELVRSALAYGAAGPDASPLQHFWSLSVQGQFFAVWPLVVLGLVAAARRTRRRARAERSRAGQTPAGHGGAWHPSGGPPPPARGLLTPRQLVTVVTLAATLASFGYALWLVTVDQPVAYFSTFTRFWEIGVGALLALAPRLSGTLPGPVRASLGWSGLALVVGSGFLVDGAVAFPGPWALVPVAGAALVLATALPDTQPSTKAHSARTRSGNTQPGNTQPGNTLSRRPPTGVVPPSSTPSTSTPSTSTPPDTTPPRSTTTPRWTAAALLDSAPLRFGARISYALYLWHWPVLVFWLLTTGDHRAGPLAGAGILVVSTALAWLTTRYVAEPALAHTATAHTATAGTRRPAPAGATPGTSPTTGPDTSPTTGPGTSPAPDTSPAPAPAGGRTHPPRTTPPARWMPVALVGAAALLLGGTQLAATAHDATVRHDVADLRTPSPDHPGAAALAPGAVDIPPTTPFRPATWVAFDDHPGRPECAQSADRPELLECTVVAQDDPTAVVYLAGASHELQYEDAFAALAREHGWELREMLKHGCRLATSGAGGLAYPSSCATWNERALDALTAARPDAVVVVGTRTFEDGSPERVMPGQVGAWRVLADAGVRVVTVRDNPRFEWFVPVCMEDESIPDACGRARAEQLAAVSPVTTADDVPGSVVHLDLTDSICGPVICSAVVGNVLVYRDDDHLTSTYVRTLTPVIHEQLRSSAPWLFADTPAP
ncbi:SGNH hydrolase domain-containing protein [Promicromonospora sp. NPDC052451]|uniref:acyltransferase family protein n=1 Tax=Promicromonospora sp. NPDC052451 TaxID=3364407 RepID=UPI0037C72829